jgi:hypothetical protein
MRLLQLFLMAGACTVAYSDFNSEVDFCQQWPQICIKMSEMEGMVKKVEITVQQQNQQLRHQQEVMRQLKADRDRDRIEFIIALHETLAEAKTMSKLYCCHAAIPIRGTENS